VVYVKGSDDEDDDDDNDDDDDDERGIPVEVPASSEVVAAAACEFFCDAEDDSDADDAEADDDSKDPCFSADGKSGAAVLLLLLLLLLWPSRTGKGIGAPLSARRVIPSGDAADAETPARSASVQMYSTAASKLTIAKPSSEDWPPSES
jgi:hypothetical protein